MEKPGVPILPGFIPHPKDTMTFTIYVDADACPVKAEVFRVAKRYSLAVRVVANSPLGVPTDADVQLVTVGQGDDVADNWIVDHVVAGDIVITADIPLAARCLERGSRVIDFKGCPFTNDSIGSQVAGRELSRHLRELGIESGGPAPMTKRDRSQFLNTLDSVIQALRREKRD